MPDASPAAPADATFAAERDPRVYFAAERTFLAWIRTGLALMGVGFAVSRFGLFLRQMAASQPHPASVGTSHSVVSGVALVLLGVIVLLCAVANHLATTRRLAEGRWQPGKPSMLAVTLAILLAIAGIGMTVFLVRLR